LRRSSNSFPHKGKSRKKPAIRRIPILRHTKAGLSLAGALVAILGLWALAAALVHKPFLPSPWASAVRLAERLADGSLALHLGASARRVGLALALAAPAAAALGLASGRSKRLDALVSPFVYLLHPLPKVAFLPVIMLFLGLGDAAKVFLIGLIIFGQILVSARDAAKAVPEALVESMRSLKCTRYAMARHLVFPYALPALLSALRVSLGTAIAVLFIAESFASEVGLGWYIVDAWTRVDYPDMYAAIIALSLFGLVTYLAIDLLEAAVCSWRKTD
jgi:ABC-type nitrate/sulfonate/bicarbonate transport system permease component